MSVCSLVSLLRLESSLGREWFSLFKNKAFRKKKKKGWNVWKLSFSCVRGLQSWYPAEVRLLWLHVPRSSHELYPGKPAYTCMCRHPRVHMHLKQLRMYTYVWTLRSTSGTLGAQPVFLFGWAGWRSVSGDMYICVSVHMHVCVGIHILRTYGYTHTRVCVCLGICVHAYMHTYIHTNSRSLSGPPDH